MQLTMNISELIEMGAKYFVTEKKYMSFPHISVRFASEISTNVGSSIHRDGPVPFRIIAKGCFGNLKLVGEVEFKCYINIRTIVCSVKVD